MSSTLPPTVDSRSEPPAAQYGLTTAYVIVRTATAYVVPSLVDAIRSRCRATSGRQGRRLAAGQFAAVFAIMAGLWVAISPWFLTLQAPRGGNATANNLIVGLVVVALGILATERLPGRLGQSAASLLAGIWVLISPFILDAKFSVTASMYWSNIWAGAVVIVAGLGLLAVCSGLTRAGRDMS